MSPRAGRPPLEIAVVGAGHVGLVTTVCLAAYGHRVRALDVDRGKVERLRAGQAPFFEPGLSELLAAGAEQGRISFHVDPAEALASARLVFLCVDTPNTADGQVDLSALTAAVRSVIRSSDGGALLVNRSTAPVGTAAFVRSLVREGGAEPRIRVAVNPEFLAEGTAVRDFVAPDRVVIGVWERQDADDLLRAYEPILRGERPAAIPKELLPGAAEPGDVPLVLTSPPTAELTKYAANAFLAVKISFINELAWIAEEMGADVAHVADAVGLDRRIGPHFLRAGIGWGGSCFPKDIVALRGMAETRGLSARILRAANEVNEEQRSWVVRKLQAHLKTLVGRRVGMLGLSFKPDTDDLRHAPALEIASALHGLGVRVRAFDPMVKEVPARFDGVLELTSDALAAAQDAEALVLVTEWSAFADLDLGRLREVMRVPLLLDGRNFFDPEAARAAGFTYVGVGR